jgi:hypothetical protein
MLLLLGEAVGITLVVAVPLLFLMRQPDAIPIGENRPKHARGLAASHEPSRWHRSIELVSCDLLAGSSQRVVVRCGAVCNVNPHGTALLSATLRSVAVSGGSQKQRPGPGRPWEERIGSKDLAPVRSA